MTRTLHNQAAGAAALAVFALVVFAACDKPKTQPPQTTATTNNAPPAEPPGPPVIPVKAEKFGPSLARVVPEEHYDVDTHMETALCSNCHAQIVDEWEDSVHAFASMSNPYYRVSFDEFTTDTERLRSRHCAGCHDPTLLFDGSITQTIQPKDRRAHVGVTCNTCHGIKEATTDGNGSYLLSTGPIIMPKDDDPHSLAKHRARLGNAVLRTNELCVSCHEGFLSPETGHDVVVQGLNEFTPFRRSGYNGNPTTRIDAGVEVKRCVDCHMPRSGPDNLPSHRFAGGHSTLAATIGSDEQLEAVKEVVQNAVTVDIGAMGVGDVRIAEPPEALTPGETLWVDVVVYNANTGHAFPGGALDLRDTWLEVELVDADGNVLADAGTEHEKEEDPSAVVLRAIVANTDGELVGRHRVHSFRTSVARHNINPRDALVSRYTWTVPESPPSLPVTARAVLKHRRLNRSITEKACADHKTERGKEFAAQTKRFFDVDVDPCRPQPIIEVGKATAELGGEQQSPDKPTWRRHWERGLGLLHNVQENLPEAIDAFQHAKKTLPKDAPKVETARIEFSLGLTASQQGRKEDAMDHFARAEEIVGEHPAIHFARGMTYQRTFRNEEAAQWFEKASKLVDDDRVWRQLAMSAGSSDQPELAYRAARKGLAIQPRDPHLLRSQMLALRKLEDVDPKWEELATKAFTEHKRDEAAAHIRDKCSANDPKCRDEREPMRITELK